LRICAALLVSISVTGNTAKPIYCAALLKNSKKGGENMPPFVYAKKFWEAVALVLAGADALLVYFGVLSEMYLYGGAAILAFIYAVLNFFGIVPELRARGFLKK